MKDAEPVGNIVVELLNKAAAMINPNSNAPRSQQQILDDLQSAIHQLETAGALLQAYRDAVNRNKLIRSTRF